MAATGSIIIILSGVFFLWKYRENALIVSEKRKRLIFLGYAIFYTIEQIGQNAYYIRLGEYWQVQYTDLCMMVILMIVIDGFFNVNWLIRMVTPWAFIGGSFESFGTPFIFDAPVYKILTTFVSHWTMFSFVFVSLLLNRFEKKDIMRSFIFIAIFIGYVGAISYVLEYVTGDVKYFEYTTMLFPMTYQSGNYEVVGSWGWPYPLPTLLFYSLSSAACYGLWKLVFLFQKHRDDKFEPKKAFVVVESES